MKARLVRIGNSRGVRIPKPLIEQVGLTDDVELRVIDGAIVISNVETAREGWSEAAAALAEASGGRILDSPTPTRFDENEWEW